MVALNIDFRQGGNAKMFLGDGWSVQEADHIWTVGTSSTVVVPGIDAHHDYRLTLDVVAYVPPGPDKLKQFGVTIGDRVVATERLSRHRCIVACEISKQIIPQDGTLSIRLLHPDPERPSDHGGTDTRRLGVAVFKAVLVPTRGSVGPPPEKEAGTGPTPDDRLTSAILRPVSDGLPKGSKMNGVSVAALTFVYNESVNLPIWIKYYGSNFGAKNLFVADRESSDGSTLNLGDVNRIVVPRNAFDDEKKADFMSHMQNALLNYYDVVICTDCDELLVPDLRSYANLSDYVSRMEFDYVTGIGLNLRHIIHREPPLDLQAPILAQRSYATFYSPTCKTLLSRVPIRWLPGLHSLNVRPKFDKKLYLFHTKAMDYNIAAARYGINRGTIWSEEALAKGHGVHHRYEYERSVRELFLSPVSVFDTGGFLPFEFEEEIAKFDANVIERNGFFWIPMNIQRDVEIPVWLRSAF